MGLSIEGRLYAESVRNLIWWDKCVVLPRCADGFGNLLAAEYQGLEVTAKLRWDEGRSFLIANYARQRASASLHAFPTQYFSPVIGDAVQDFYTNKYLALFPESAPLNSGSLLLSGANGFTGGTTVGAGTLVLAGGAALADGGALALAAGGTTHSEPQDHGFMYAHAFQDLDGHIWELVHIGPGTISGS